MRRSKLFVSCTALLLALPGVAVPAAASAASPDAAIEPSTGRPVVASGMVVRAGIPESGASVSIFAKPTPGALARAGDAGLRLLPLGQSSTNGVGGFSVAGDLAGLPGSYRGSLGGVDILLVTMDASSSVSWSYTLYPSSSKIREGFVAPADGAAAPVSGRYADGRTAPATHIDLASGSVWDIGNDPANWLDASGQPLGNAAHSDPSRRVAINAPQPGLATYARVFLAAATAERTGMLNVRSSSRALRAFDPKATGCGVIGTWTCRRPGLRTPA